MAPANEVAADRVPSNGRRPDVVRPAVLIGLGVLAIFGGEAFCILGPMRYQPVIHVVCHAILYSGMALAGLGAILYWRGNRELALPLRAELRVKICENTLGADHA